MTPSHLSDDRLVEVCLVEPPSVAEEQHLGACARCDARRAQLLGLLDDIADVSGAEADAAFPPERLARQHARILAQLAHDGRPARVIAFPAAHVHDAPTARTRPPSRWIAAAAVAGLVIGLFAGRFGHDFSMGRSLGSRMATRTTAEPGLQSTTEASTLREASVASEEEFLNQIEVAIDGPTAAALQPIDDLTPRAWDQR